MGMLIKTLKRISSKIINFQTFLILFLVYILIVPFFATLFRMKKDKKINSWLKWNYGNGSLDAASKQY